MSGWDTPLSEVKGIGAKRAALFSRLGVLTLEHLLTFAPRRYEDRSRIAPLGEIQPGEQTVCGRLLSVTARITPRKKMHLVQALVDDASGLIVATWFNQPYLVHVLKPGKRVMLSGRVKRSAYSGNLELESPQYEIVDEREDPIHTGRIVGIYPETQGLSSRQIRALLHEIIGSSAVDPGDFLPPEILDRHHLFSLHQAIRELHFPSAGEVTGLNEGRGPARRRLVFDEFFLLQIGLALRKRGARLPERIRRGGEKGERLARFLETLPFRLTGAQRRVVEEIRKDLSSDHPMNRLLQGDVGSGKTVVAAAAIVTAAEGGVQSALMAPTEILAEQHADLLRRLLEPIGLRVEAVTSGMPAPRRREVREAVRTGAVTVAVGTHALLEEHLLFPNLGLIVVDEQHKFGVLQRAGLIRKGEQPDVLMMTATPIPRTLALTLYGDLDISVLDEMPPGRTPVETQVVGEKDRKEAYAAVAVALSAGHQAFIVYPVVEESEKVDLRAATQMAERLRQVVFPRARVALLHGRMKSAEKDRWMRLFLDRQVDILVTTTVVEVGIDVPNATVMMVEHAERFGLAQLHQLRGRVGRGTDRSLCILVAGERPGPDARRRLEAVFKSRDGFQLAEEDLAIRGPGEFFGTRQAGLPELRVANLVRDTGILHEAREEALRLVAEDPDLSHPAHRPLAEALARRWREALELAIR